MCNGTPYHLFDGAPPPVAVEPDDPLTIYGSREWKQRIAGLFLAQLPPHACPPQIASPAILNNGVLSLTIIISSAHRFLVWDIQSTSFPEYRPKGQTRMSGYPADGLGQLPWSHREGSQTCRCGSPMVVIFII
jgi:hypothetical protein